MVSAPQSPTARATAALEAAFANVSPMSFVAVLEAALAANPPSPLQFSQSPRPTTPIATSPAAAGTRLSLGRTPPPAFPLSPGSSSESYASISSFSTVSASSPPTMEPAQAMESASLSPATRRRRKRQLRRRRQRLNKKKMAQAKEVQDHATSKRRRDDQDESDDQDERPRRRLTY